MNCFRFNQHTPTHIFGCYALTLTLCVWNVSLLIAAATSMLAGILWEFIGDGYFGAKKFYPMFDSRGPDGCDIIADGIGTGLAVLVVLLL